MTLYYFRDKIRGFYLTPDREPTDKRTEAGKFTEAQFKAWELEPEFECIPVGEDVIMRQLDAPMLPGLENLEAAK